MMGWGSQGYGMWGMGGSGGVVMILFWGLIIAGLVLVIRYFTSGQGTGPADPVGRDPLEILRERYARGEIDTEEFEERRKILGGGT